MLFLMKPHIQGEGLDLRTGSHLRVGGLIELNAQGSISSGLCCFSALPASLTTFDVKCLTPALKLWPGMLHYGNPPTLLPRTQNGPEMSTWLLGLLCYFSSGNKYPGLDIKWK